MSSQWGSVMFGLVGLVGLMFLGTFADGMMSMFKSSSADGGEDNPAGDPAEAGNDADTFAHGDLLTDLHAPTKDGDGPDLTDDPIPIDADLVLQGTDDIDILAGNGGNDTVSGEGGDDLIEGRGGADEIDGGNGSDAVHGGSGDDLISGNAGVDDLEGEDGDDTLLGGEGDDYLAGHEGQDWLDGDTGADSLIGGSGLDLLFGGADDDTLDGGFGDDQLSGGAGTDLMQGGAGNDTLQGDDGPEEQLDYLNGGDGDDVMILGGNDMGFGATGHDTFGLNADNQHAATISDYNPAEDHIVLQYDAAAHPNPTVTIEPGVEDDGSVAILLDGQVLAHVTDGAGMTAADVTLQPI